MIDVQDLHKSFKQQVVLDGASIFFAEGKITTILGGSGSGKSVLVKHIIGLLRPDSGTIVVDGQDLETLDDRELLQVRKKFGYLFQDSALFDFMNVFDNISFPLFEHTRLKRSEVQHVVAEKLRLVGLAGIEKKMPSELSGGMKKRVALARAVALDPKIIIYDEPTTGLDPVMTDTVNDLIATTQEALGITTIVISHDIRSSLRISDFLGLLNEGKIVEFGTPEKVQESEHPMMRLFLAGIERAPVSKS
ncbi:MAG: ABC transporter ATP-binding protein [Deltaproteobacteria bacterium RIFOXYA12_FULL_61_11]|nr:MAG: ABC transporter ATP-binding protein [Deltaproteobacteria bacterium RIFOXYA12_FULL_61_11]